MFHCSLTPVCPSRDRGRCTDWRWWRPGTWRRCRPTRSSSLWASRTSSRLRWVQQHVRRIFLCCLCSLLSQYVLCTELNELQPLRDSMMHVFIYSCSVSRCINFFVTLLKHFVFTVLFFYFFYYRIHSNSIVPFLVYVAFECKILYS